MDDLRLLLMREPRGHGAMSGAILQPPLREDADWGVLFIEVSGLLRCAGTGRSASRRCWSRPDGRGDRAGDRDPARRPAGLVEARVAVEDGRATAVTIRNVASFLHAADRVVEVPGLGTVRYDMAYGGNFYALTPAGDIGLAVDPSRSAELVDAGLAVMAAINEADRPVHPEDPRIGAAVTSCSTRPGATEPTPSRRRRSIPAGWTGRRAERAPRRGWRRCTRAARCAWASRS